MKRFLIVVALLLCSIGASAQTTQDPCTKFAKIHAVISATTNTKIFSSSKYNKAYICAVNLVVAAATNVSIVEGTGTVCGTGTAGIFGGATAATGWNFAANGGIAYGNGGAQIGVTAGETVDVCILVSAANQVSGSIDYVLANVPTS